MEKKCPKCGFKNHHNEITPLSECPICGIIYERYEKIQNRKSKEKITAKEQEDKLKKKREKSSAKKMRRQQLKQKIQELFKPSLKKIFSTLLVICVLAGSILVFITHKKDSNYLADLRLANSVIALSTMECIEMCQQYSTVWKKAIESKYNSDFNEAIRLQRSRFELYGDIDNIDKSKKVAGELIQRLNEHKKLYPEAHMKIVELYGVYSQLNSLAQFPSGSLMSFNKQVNDLQGEYIKISSELNVLLPKEK